MRIVQHLKTLLLIALLALTASGAANAKVASGLQNLGADLYQAKASFNLLMHQGKTLSSYDDALGSSVVTKGGGQKLGDLSIAKKQRGAVGTRRAPEFDGGKVSESGFLDSAEKWLGSGYKSLPNGRYVSKDGLRQVRYGRHETTSKRHHGHFEAYDRPGGRVIENTSVEIVP